MVENITVKILWLSDIHFRNTYEVRELENAFRKNCEGIKQKTLDKAAKRQQLSEAKKKFQEQKNKLKTLDVFLEKFFEAVKQSGKTFDYVLLSGDLAFSSTKEDYTVFHDKVIKGLKNILGNGPQFLSIPGNHDVFWENTDFFDSFLDEINTQYEGGVNSFFQFREQYLKRKRDFFKLIFTNYTDYFKTHIRDDLKSRYTHSPKYVSNGLYGYIVDRKNNLIINLLNSAWYALGQQFDTMLLDSFIKRYKKILLSTAQNETKERFYEDFKACLSALVTVKNSSIEYGGQIIGMPPDDAVLFIEKTMHYSNYFVITAFHHPPNWLYYSEKYAGEIKNNDTLFFNRLLNRTELLLTGHEHVPSSVNYERLNNHAIHLKAGMFMQDNMFNASEGQHRFSILEVNTSKFSFNEEKYYYNWTTAQWKLDNIYSHYNVVIPKKQPIFNRSRTGQYMTVLQNRTYLSQLLETYFFINEKISDYTIKSNNAHPAFSLLNLISGSVIKRTLVIIKDNSFFGDLLVRDVDKGEKHIFTQILKLLVKFDPALKITLLVPDFLVDENLTNHYESTDFSDKIGVYYSITKRADFIFNISRHRFFNQFESIFDPEDKNKSLEVNSISFDDIKNIQFSNLVIPFWVIEKFAYN
jgi:hypothetical protein